MLRARIIATLIALNTVATGSASTINFDDILPGSLIGSTYETNGFLLTGKPRSPYFPGQFYVQSSASELWTGTPGLVFGEVGATLELRTSAGTVFDAISIDISKGDTNRFNVSVPVTFSGNKASGASVNVTYWLKDSDTGINRTFIFGKDFLDLTSLVWQQGALFHQIDNLTVTAASVPEPSTLSLLLSSFCAIAWCRRRRAWSSVAPL